MNTDEVYVEKGEYLNKGYQKPLKYKVSVNGCWEVTSHYAQRDGYPMIKRRPVSTGVLETKPTSRFVYEDFNEVKLPSELFVRHKCDNKMCVNPDHLETGSHKDNMNDMKTRKRAASGERNGNSILTDEQVSEIVRLVVETDKTYESIGSLYGVGKNYVSSIIKGKKYRNVTGGVVCSSYRRRGKGKEKTN
jgi:hypothetical protein